MAAKAVALTEASRPEFADYAQRIVDNAATLADALQQQGATVITGGTDNHLLLVDARPYGLTGRQAEAALREAGITLNRNVIPFDPNGSWYTSGLRLGTPAVTTLGMGADEMREVAAIVHAVLESTQPVPDSKAKYQLDPASATRPSTAPPTSLTGSPSTRGSRCSGARALGTAAQGDHGDCGDPDHHDQGGGRDQERRRSPTRRFGGRRR